MEAALQVNCTMDRINFLMSFFQGRVDSYGIEKAGKVLAEHQPVSIKLFQDHISGKIRLGIYPVNGDDTTHWACIDFDTPDRARVEATYAKLVERGFIPHLEASREKGFHIWLFFDAPVQAEDIRRVLHGILHEAGVEAVEVFPKQDHIAEGEFGNFVFLPLNGASLEQGKTAFLNLSFEPYSDQWTYLEKIRRTPAVLINSFFNSLLTPRAREEAFQDSHTKSQLVTGSHKILTFGTRNNDLFHIANCLLKNRTPIEDVTQYLEILAKTCDPPFSLLEVQEIIKHVLKRVERRERNVSEEVRQWVLVTDGHFIVTDVHRESQLVTKEERHAANVTLRRMVEEGIIEKYGDKRGVYRRIDRSIEFMDFANANIENSIDLRLPLGLHSKTKIFPKGIIVVAGVSGMGKTLLAFNSIADNMGKFQIFYFNSEMGPEALKQKLSHFPIGISEWEKHMKVIDNWDFNNISDKVQPDAFNVIDYLEPEGDRPYNIHGVISSIIRRLNKGTALITIQKKPNSTMGTGGIYSIKAATLAIALDWGKIEIVKNRFREVDPTPSLNRINFEVHAGYQFVRQGDWYKESK